MNTVTRLGSILGALLLAATGLSSVLAQEHPAPPMESAATSAPTTKQILQVLFDALDTPLSVSETCAGVGTEADDRVIGDFIAGFMAEMGARTGHNWIEIAAEPTRAIDGHSVWQCRVILRRQYGEEEWGWGVGFQLGNLPPYTFERIGPMPGVRLKRFANHPNEEKKTAWHLKCQAVLS